MPETNDLDRRIKERLALSEESRQLRANHTQQSMKVLDDRCARYGVVADRLMETVIRPRVHKLKDHFGDGALPESRNSRHTCLVEFEHCARFPATVRLEFGVTRDGEATTVIVQYKLEILPVFFQFQGHDELSMPLDIVDEIKVTAWVEDKVMAFVDTYLKLETAAPYQEENVVNDPVCGMRVNKNHAAASMDYIGVRYYFCVEECRAKFSEDPALYVGSGSAK